MLLSILDIFFPTLFIFGVLAVVFCLLGELKYVQTRRGAIKLVYHGYYFYKESSNGNKIVWKCSMYEKTRCHSRCHTFDYNRITYGVFSHNHEPPTVPDSNFFHPVPHSQRFSNNPYPEPNQPNSPH